MKFSSVKLAEALFAATNSAYRHSAGYLLVRVCHLLASPHLPCFWCDWWTDSFPVAFSRSSSLCWPQPYPSLPTASFPGPTVLIYSANSHMEALPYFPWGRPFFPLNFLGFLHLRSVQWDYLNVKMFLHFGYCVFFKLSSNLHLTFWQN